MSRNLLSFLSLSIISLILFSCSNQESSEVVQTEDYTQYVNPFIGTSKMGHTFPGATAPFGMVQLSPQTNFVPMYKEDGTYNKTTYEYCAGYQYKDSTIIGFAHTNLSGTGHSDLGDFLIMPTVGKLTLNPLDIDTSNGFASSFSHDNEVASPGYYSVELDDYKIKAELTASERVGFHQYTFPETDSAHIILDMVYNVYHHDDKNVWTFIRVENDTLITGYRQTQGWARNRTAYFAMAFSKPFTSYGHIKYEKPAYNGFYRRFNEEKNFPEMAGKDIRAYFNFETSENEKINIKFALSHVGIEGALLNMKTEVDNWNFDKVREETREKWNKELSIVDVETIDDDQKVTFYTAMYHSMLSPIIYEDVDGTYTGLDKRVYNSDEFTHYSIFSLWDTYRALHPLYNIIQPERNNDMIKSMLAHQQQSVHGMLPIWSHYGNENWCMIGYHATSVIADAVVKNVGDFDRDKALDACVETSKVPYFDGLGYYIDYGYVPDDLSHSSVSKTLELAYNDWCITQLASNLGTMEVLEVYEKRAQNYYNVFDTLSRYMRPRLSDGSFRAEFDPLDTHGQGFIEGNAWNYGLYVPQNIDRMIEMMGGKEKFSLHLDSLFTMEIDDKYIEKHEDITRDGIIGNYVHGNEPGHHIPYLYNWCDHPNKTQARVRMICETMYGPGVEGLCGNDDAGQMSAWYIFSSLGFYPVCPGSEYYALGSPNLVSASIKLQNGKTLKINTENQSKENIFVEKVTFNGEEITDNQISHHQLMEGGELLFEMTNLKVQK